MAVTITHPTVATGADDPTKEINKGEWNAAHTVTQAGERMLGKPTAGAGATEEMTGAQVLTFAGAEASGTAAAAVAAHEGAADPHTGYQKESEKNAANGYAGLDAGTKLAGAQQTYGTLANTACEGNDARLSDARAPTGAASGDLGGTYPGPTVTQARGLRETTGPTTLTMGAVADGQFLKRVGTTVVGASGAGGGDTYVTATVDFGASQTCIGDFTVSDASFSGKTYAKAFVMSSDTTVDNNALVHEMAGALLHLTCDAPSGTNVGVHARALAGTISGTLKIRIEAA